MFHQVDSELIHTLAPFLITDYEKLHYTRKSGLRKLFSAGVVRDFELTYRDPEFLNYADAFYSLEKIKDRVLTFETVVCRAYLPKLQEVKDRYILLHATLRQDDKTFFEQSELIYGLPKLSYYRYAMRGLRKILSNVSSLGLVDDRVNRAIATLLPLQVEDTLTSWDSIVLPLPVLSQEYQTLCTADITELCEAAFQTYNITGWQTRVAKPGQRITFNVNQEEKILHIPHDNDIRLRKFPLTRLKMEALIAHEIGTHIVRRQNGEQSPLALLGFGLAGYLTGEEGIATYREQRVRGATQFSGIMGYLAVSWVVGLDGTPRTFRQLFELMVPYLFLSVLDQQAQSNLPLNLDNIEENVKRNAWARCVRTFRGVTGRSAGYCLTRDISYLEGNIAVWQLLEADPNFERYFEVGKYDPTNKEHVSIIKELGLLD